MRRGPAATVFGCSAVLLSYPEDDWASDLVAVSEALGGLPHGSARTRLETATAWLAGLPLLEAEAGYVETFDLRKRRSLHLSWYRHGDTRERGMALAALGAVYRQAGLRVAQGELPDYLPALLELAALDPAGTSMLSEYRASLDALAEELEKAESRYAGVVRAVTEALGATSKGDREALRRYRAQGPPSERVGLEPFAPPEAISQGLTIR